MCALPTSLEGDAEMPPLDRESCRRARLSRDARFDGQFFLGVKTTGIYCRPICPARMAAEKNVEYFANAALAAQSGFRPCLRCRPESAPNSPAWEGRSTTVSRALRLIEEGELNHHSVEQLAARLGIGERYLRKLFQAEVGTSPAALAENQRLLFAKKMLAETALPITEIAYAAGFTSVRRFNGAVKQHFDLTPSQMRKASATHLPTSGIQLQLHYRPPYDWAGVMAFFMRHEIRGVESASLDGYSRRVMVGRESCRFALTPSQDHNALLLQIDTDSPLSYMPMIARVRRMFDLDAHPVAIESAFSRGVLAPLLVQYPGIRVPGSWSLFESALRTIIGQQVSTAAARGIITRMSAAVFPQSNEYCFPSAQQIAELDDSHLPMPGRRRQTVRDLCALSQRVGEALNLEHIAALPGVGPWTVAVCGMRGLGHPDAFPETDLGIKQAWEKLSPDSTLKSAHPRWRPWRSYATSLLWRSLAT